jgi:NDP-sugar pyrophosphorylase family protein
MTGVRHAVVLAGGLGTRLMPYTTSLPKPLVPIAGELPIIEIVLRQLAARGFGRATIAIGHLGALIQAVVADGAHLGIGVDYAMEDEPLGTMGPVVQLLDRLPEHFLVLNGDVLTDLDFGAVLDAHAASGAPLTITTHERLFETDLGVLDLEGDVVVGFREKPTIPLSVSMGVYGLSRSTLSSYTAGVPLGFDRLVLDLLGREPAPRAFRHSGYWVDIGRPEEYERANVEFAERRAALLPGVEGRSDA